MTMKYWTIIAGTLALFASAQSTAAVLTFESAPSRGLGDNDQVTNEFQSDFGISFSGAYLEHTLFADADPQGFLNDVTGRHDDPVTRFPAPPGLGDWFLRSGGDVGDRGPGDTLLTVHYASSVDAASGQIWDIDGNDNQGSEQWTVEAYLNNTLVTQVVSPELDNNGTGSMNAEYWTFNLSGVTFDELQFVFTGTKQRGIGLAFDNFSPASTTTPTPVPAPAVMWLFGLGLGMVFFGAALRRRSRHATARLAV